MKSKTTKVGNYIVRIIYDYHRNMYIGKFDGTSIPNVYGDTERELYQEINEAIDKHEEREK